jgi:hypothetical protein
VAEEDWGGGEEEEKLEEKQQEEKKQEEDDPLPELPPDQVMQLVVNEMLTRTWISPDTAAAMSDPSCPQRAVLVGAIQAFLLNQDFEELLDTFLIASRHVEGAPESDEEEETGTRPKLLDESVGDHNTSQTQASPATSSPLALSKVLGISPSSDLTWVPAAGLLAYSTGNTVVLEDLEQVTQAFAYHASGASINSIAVSDDNQFLATGATPSEECLQVSEERRSATEPINVTNSLRVQIWSTTSAPATSGLYDLFSLPMLDSAGIASLCFTLDDSLLIAISLPTTDSVQKLLIWDFLTESSVARVYELTSATSCLASLASSPANPSTHFATGGDSGL